MGETTAIEWADATFNPWHGCEKVSPACDHCYAEAFARRTGHDIWGHDNERRLFGDKHWNEPLRWNEKAEAEGVRRRVFCASMADVFESRDDLDSQRARLWELIDRTPWLDWMLLTKRPEQVRQRVPAVWLAGRWPSNVWLGVTVENDRYARIRIPRLLAVPGVPVRFLSCEPMLGPVDLSRWLHIEWMDALRPPDGPLSFRGEGGWGLEMFAALAGERPAIDWVICGGESGAGHRPMDPAWARDLLDQCLAADVPFMFKQWGGRTPKAGGRELDGRTWDGVPVSPLA